SAIGWNCVDADYGIIPWEYFTYFFFAHDTEQQPQLALFNKIFTYLSFHTTGVGQLVITPFVDALNNPWLAFPAYPLSLSDTGFDFDLGNYIKGNRMSLRFTGQQSPSYPQLTTGSAMWLTH